MPYAGSCGQCAKVGAVRRVNNVLTLQDAGFPVCPFWAAKVFLAVLGDDLLFGVGALALRPDMPIWRWRGVAAWGRLPLAGWQLCGRAVSRKADVALAACTLQKGFGGQSHWRRAGTAESFENWVHGAPSARPDFSSAIVTRGRSCWTLIV